MPDADPLKVELVIRRVARQNRVVKFGEPPVTTTADEEAAGEVVRSCPRALRATRGGVTVGGTLRRAYRVETRGALSDPVFGGGGMIGRMTLTGTRGTRLAVAPDEAIAARGRLAVGT